MLLTENMQLCSIKSHEKESASLPHQINISNFNAVRLNKKVLKHIRFTRVRINDAIAKPSKTAKDNTHSFPSFPFFHNQNPLTTGSLDRPQNPVLRGRFLPPLPSLIWNPDHKYQIRRPMTKSSPCRGNEMGEIRYLFVDECSLFVLGVQILPE